MKIPVWLLVFRLFALVPAFAAGPASSAPPSAPNVILVLIDDMGWGDFSCFGNEEASTPNIDRLAAEGIAFEQFYVNSPICSPSRVAISTGQYPQRWRITSYLAHRKLNEARGIAHWLDPEAPTLARFLHEAGFATGHFGKWHMGGQRDIPEAPLITEYGFEESFTNFEGLGPRVLPLKFVPGNHPPRPHNLGSQNLGHGPVIWHDRAFVTAKFVEAAIVFARFAESQGRPYYLNLWPDDVHTPMHPPLDQWGDGEDRTRYLAVLEEMDRQLGPLFDFVREEPDRRDNTIVLVCSDNGPEVGFGSAGPWHGHKATLHEGGIRSPLIAWAPGLMPQDKQGSRDESSVFSAMDLVPSLLALTPANAPAGTSFDGENLSGTLLGTAPASRTRPLFFRRPPDRNTFRHYQNLPDLAVRDGYWKLTCDYDGSDPRLYHLNRDPGETTNLAGDNLERVNALTAKLLAWNERLPQDNGATYSRAGRKRD